MEGVEMVDSRRVVGRVGNFVYQDTSPQFANAVVASQPRRQKRRQPQSLVPPTPLQIARRLLFAAVVAAFKALSEKDLGEWNARFRKAWKQGSNGERRYYSVLSFYMSTNLKD